MPLFIYVFLCAVTAIVYSLMPYKRSLIESFFVFFAVSMLVTSTYSALGINMQRVAISDEFLLAIPFLIYRSVLLPVIITATAGELYRSRSWRRRGMILLLVWVLLIALEWLSNTLSLHTYVNWNIGYMGILLLIFLGWGWMVMQWFVKLDRCGVERT